MAKALVLLLLSAALLARGAGSDDSSRRRSEEASAVLQAVVGKDRGRVIVEAAIEQNETRTIADGATRVVHTTANESTRSLKAVVFVDQALPEDAVRRGTEAVAEVLGLDEARGDDLKLVRAPLSELPPEPRDARALAGMALAGACVLAAAIVAWAMRAAASRLSAAVAGRASAPVTVTVTPPAAAPTPVSVHVPAPPSAAPAPAGPARRIEILPRLGDGDRA